MTTGESIPRELRGWTIRNLRGPFSIDRILRRLEKEGLPPEARRQFVLEIATEKTRRWRRGALLAGGTGVVLLLAGTALAVAESRWGLRVFGHREALGLGAGGLASLGTGLFRARRSRAFARAAREMEAT